MNPNLPVSPALVFVTLLIKLGAIASLASIIARFGHFKRLLFIEQRGPRQKLVFAAFLGVPFSYTVTGANSPLAYAADALPPGLGFNPARALLSRKPELPPPGPLDTNVTRPTPPGTVPTPSTSTTVYDAPVPVVDIMVATGEVIRSTVASSLLEFYAGYTGGVFYSHWKKKIVEEQLGRIGADIHSQYELAYAPDTLEEGGFHRIQVKVLRPGVKVRARAGYFYQVPTASAQGAKP